VARDLPTIFIDSREESALEFSSDVVVERVTLPIGDYSIAGHSDRIVFKRKSVCDLVRCCKIDRKRFIDECRRLGEFERAAIVADSTILLDIAGWNYRGATGPRSILGTINTVWLDYGVPVFEARES
jgi:ERCC4-type nuclease